MAREIRGDLLLSPSESITFVHNLLQPDKEALRRRDEFLRDMEGLEISFDRPA